MKATYLQSYGCTTGVGAGVEAFWNALETGKSAVQDGVSRIFKDPLKSSKETCIEWLHSAFQECQFSLSARLGVILASTKGAVEDYIKLYPEGNWENLPDTLTPVLEAFLEKENLKPELSICVSNACASSHAALFLAQSWLNSDRCDQVIVLAIDEVGPFIEKGFRSLQAITKNQPTPFGQNRDGLGLGEGAAVLVLSHKKSDLEILPVSLITEAVPFTRPSEDGIGLEAAIRECDIAGFDVIVAHATGTEANDATEARVFSRLAPHCPVTATKWCVGHTLGASGSMDLIAAAEILRRKTLFNIATTETLDASLQCRIAYSKREWDVQSLHSILVTSLGFGGMNAAFTIREVP